MAIKFDGPQVGFFRGSQANLQALGSYQDGAFYITTDDNRLYYAQGNDNLVYLNKSITAVENQTALFAITNPIDGEFYYVKDGNILCYYSATADTNEPGVGTSGKWIQVNVQTVDTDISVSAFDIADAKVENNQLVFTFTLSQKDKDGNAAGTQVSDQFVVTKANIEALVDHNISLTASKPASNSYTVALGGSDATQVSYKVTGAGSVAITGSANDITITGTDTDTTYDLSNTGTTIKLTEADGGAEVGTVAFLANKKSAESTAANADIVLDSTDDKEIVIKHYDYSDGPITNANVKDAAPAAKGQFAILKGINVTNGHVTGVTTATITLPEDKNDNTYVESITADNTGKITITQNDGTTVPSEEVLFYKINDKAYYNQGSLDLGIQEYIEANLSKITNAMTFKGSVTGSAEGKTMAQAGITSASIGDTYIVKSGVITGGDDDATTGDILIANGTEDSSTGLITGTIEWIVIPGEEEDTTYELNAASNQIQLKVTGGAVSDYIALTDDNVVNLETTSDGKIKGSHATITKADTTPNATLEHSKTFKAVTGVTYNNYGHVTGVATTTFTMPDNPDQTNNHVLVNDGTSTLLQNAEGADQGSIKINGDAPIAVTATDNGAGTDYKVSHAKITKNNTTPTDTVKNNTSFTAVTGVTYDDYGHTSGVATTTYTLDVDIPEYELSGATVTAGDNAVTVTDSLSKDGAAAGTSAFTIASANSNLTISASGSTINVGLIWGTF